MAPDTDEITRPRPVSTFERIRRARGLRQAQVAERAGCSRSLISMAEAGYRPPHGRQLAIAEALGVDAALLWPAEDVDP